MRSEAVGDWDQRLKPLGVGRRGPSYTLDVLEFSMDGSYREATIPRNSIGLPTRDLNLFSTSKFAPPQSTISPRNGCIIIRMEDVRAVVKSDRTYVIVQGLRRVLRDRLAESLASRFTAHSHKNEADPEAYELRAMETLLAEQASRFESKLRHLLPVVEHSLKEISSDLGARDLNSLGLQRLLPVKRAMTELENDIHEAHDAMWALMHDEPELRDLGLTAHAAGEEATAAMHDHAAMEAEGILNTYRRVIRAVGGELKEMRNTLEATEEVWRMQMDSARNRTLQINLYITAVSLGFTAATVPAGIMGMNLMHGWEEHPTMFWQVCGAVGAFSAATFAATIFLYRGWTANSHAKRVEEARAIRDLVVFHGEDVDYMLQRAAASGEELTRDRFVSLVREAIPSKEFGLVEVNILYDMFDKDGDGSLHLNEWRHRIRGPGTEQEGERDDDGEKERTSS